jgi:rubrerythrin
VERITTKEELVGRLKDVRAVEMQARDGYVEDMATFTNIEIKKAVTEIKHDEDRHIAMLDELISALES